MLTTKIPRSIQEPEEEQRGPAQEPMADKECLQTRGPGQQHQHERSRASTPLFDHHGIITIHEPDIFFKTDMECHRDLKH